MKRLCPIALVLLVVGCGASSADSADGGAGSVAPGLDGGTPTSSTSSDGGAVPGTCAASCSGHGRCVELDGAKTCACESGYYEVGLACVEDPCAGGGDCRYVDPAGDDNSPGTAAKPWRSLAKVEQMIAGLPPGAYVLLRRGGDWSGEDLWFQAKGTEALPITVGAYGPVGDARPKVRQVFVSASAHVTVRDVESADSEEGPCIAVNTSSHVTIQDTVVHGCQNNGIGFGGSTEYGVLLDNLVYNIRNNDALSIHSEAPLTAENTLGDHFWVVDNRVPGPVAEETIDIATGDDAIRGSRDLKIVGNVVGRGGSGCVTISHGSSVAWIVGNTLGQCPTRETSAALTVGGEHGALSGTSYQIRGNLIFWNIMYAGLVLTQSPGAPEVIAEQNTIVPGSIALRAVWLNGVGKGRISFNKNLVWANRYHENISFYVAPNAVSLVNTQNTNWFVPNPENPDCELNGSSLADWKLTGFDAASSCGEVPGMAPPAAADIADFKAWSSSAFLDRFVPDASWAGCASGIGAFDCNGSRRIRFEPFAGYADNGGYGWEGPRAVRQRYRLKP